MARHGVLALSLAALAACTKPAPMGPGSGLTLPSLPGSYELVDLGSLAPPESTSCRGSEAVAINIRNIDAHRGKARLADCGPGDGLEASAAKVDPSAIRRMRIIADVKVGRAIAVEIPEDHTQSPIIRRR